MDVNGWVASRASWVQQATVVNQSSSAECRVLLTNVGVLEVAEHSGSRWDLVR